MPDKPTPSIPKVIWLVLVGVLVPILAAVMPLVIGSMNPERSLLFTYQGPIQGEKGLALAIDVKNDGKQLEEGIEVWIPISTVGSIEIKKNKYGDSDIINVDPVVSIETNVSSTIEAKQEGTHIVRIPSLRPKEQAHITAFASGGRAYVLSHELKGMRVVSKETVGRFDGPNEFLEYMYKVGTWLFAAFFLIAFGASAYVEWLMPKHKKEEYLLKQIDKLGK